MSTRVAGLGALFIAGSAVLAARLTWEQTVWSWERGPQMVGFSLAHGPLAPLLLFPIALVTWLVAVAVLTVRGWTRGQRPSWVTYLEFTAALAVLGVLHLSDGFWQRAFITRFATGPHATRFLVHDAAAGDLATVKALVSHGVPVDGRDPLTGQTALHGAATAGRLAVLEYLVSRGADVNAIDGYGDSPLENAIAGTHQDAARFLERQGGRRVRGAPERRRKATEGIVRGEREDMSQDLDVKGSPGTGRR